MHKIIIYYAKNKINVTKEVGSEKCEVRDENRKVFRERYIILLTPAKFV